MDKDFEQRKNIIDKINRLENMYHKFEELNKTITMLNQYCKAYINMEGIYNITSITQLLDDLSNDIFKEICFLIDGEINKKIPQFILDIKQLNLEESFWE